MGWGGAVGVEDETEHEVEGAEDGDGRENPGEGRWGDQGESQADHRAEAVAFDGEEGGGDDAECGNDGERYQYFFAVLMEEGHVKSADRTDDAAERADGRDDEVGGRHVTAGTHLCFVDVEQGLALTHRSILSHLGPRSKPQKSQS